MGKELNKFRDSMLLFPSLAARSQDLLALILCEISKVNGVNKSELKKAVQEHRAPQLTEVPDEYFFSSEDLVKLFGTSEDVIRVGADRATEDLVGAKLRNKFKDGGFRKLVVVSEAIYEVGVGLTLICYRNGVNRLAENLGSDFSEVDLKMFVSLSGANERRALKIISGCKNGRQAEHSIDELRDLFSATDKYKRVTDFFKNAVDPSFKRVIESSNGVWTPTDIDGKGYKVVRKNRKIQSIKLCMKYNPNPRVIDGESEEISEEIAELKQTEQYILSMPIVPKLIGDPYVQKARELGHKIPVDVQLKIKGHE